MRLLFLDVDGVLNSTEVLNTPLRFPVPVGEHHLRLLNTLVTQTGCQIVLSSTWRLSPEYRTGLRAAFEHHGIPEWIGTTPDLKTGRRADEILGWLRSHVTVPAVAVGIDDAEDIDIGNDHGLEVRFKTLTTDPDSGLTAEVVQQAVDWFARHTFNRVR